MSTTDLANRLPAGARRRIRDISRSFGVDIVRHWPVPEDFDADEVALVEAVRPYTLTSPERIVALANAVDWLIDEKIPGDFVECGVWRGGSMMAVARCLLRRNATDRDLYLFDTFEGITAPTPKDHDLHGQPALPRFLQTRINEDSSTWCRATIDDVERNLARTWYPPERVHLVKGRVEDTLPATEPHQIAMLRLDTDWYESTRHELVHLWPKLVSGGICIADDYGHWAGHRKAIDEYLEDNGIRVLMHRPDGPGRVFVKP